MHKRGEKSYPFKGLHNVALSYFNAGTRRWGVLFIKGGEN